MRLEKRTISFIYMTSELLTRAVNGSTLKSYDSMIVLDNVDQYVRNGKLTINSELIKQPCSKGMRYVFSEYVLFSDDGEIETSRLNIEIRNKKAEIIGRTTSLNYFYSRKKLGEYPEDAYMYFPLVSGEPIEGDISKIKLLVKASNGEMRDIFNTLGISKQAFAVKLKSDNFKIMVLKKIAAMYDAELILNVDESVLNQIDDLENTRVTKLRRLSAKAGKDFSYQFELRNGIII